VLMKTLKYVLLFSYSVSAVLLCGLLVPAYGQVPGCKDPTANNYNPSATVNNGTCTYNTTLYTPPLKVDPISTTLVETSGLQMAGNFLWSFNDGGGLPAIYRMDTISNAILQTVNLSGITNVDWEDIAFDGSDFYIGDFGNNANGARTDLKIYKFPLSAIPDYTTDPVTTISAGQVEVINYTYNDQVPVVATGSNNTKFDCEAMIVDGGKIHLFSKNWVDATTTHYVINGTTAGTYTAMPLETLATTYLVTAADKVPGLNIIALLGYQNSGFGNHFMYLLSDFSSGLYFNGNKHRIDLPNAATMGQAEGITFRTNSYGYISNEKFVNFITVNQRLRSFNTASFVPAYVLALDLLNFKVRDKDGAHELNWNFASPVKNLKILVSSNRAEFRELKSFTTSTTGSFLNQHTTALNCYKLSWQKPDGRIEYSNSICLNEKVETSISNVVLHSNGQLNFILPGTKAQPYLFKLLTTDGKLIAQTKERIIPPGSNTIQFLKNLSGNDSILVQAISNNVQKTVLVKMQ